MKKIIYSIFALSLILSGSMVVTSCSSDDGGSTEVNPNPGPSDNDPQTQTLVVNVSATTAYLGETITLSATLDGAAVTSGVTYYVDDVAISGNTITSNSVAEMLVSAKYQNVTSDYVSIAFAENPFLGVEGEGNFVYNGSTYQLDGAYLVLQGFYGDGNGGATAYWMQYGWSGNNPNTADNFIAIGFDTPATVEGQNVTDYVLPDANQNIYYGILGLETNGQSILSEAYLGGSGVITYNSLASTANPVTADFSIQTTGDHNVTFNYIGDVSPISTASARKVNKSKFVNVSKVVKTQAQKEIDRAAFLSKISKK